VQIKRINYVSCADLIALNCKLEFGAESANLSFFSESANNRTAVFQLFFVCYAC